MSRIAENTIEDFAIKLLEHLGYEYIYAPSIAYDGEIEINSYHVWRTK